jgi:hypothetical protein
MREKGTFCGGHCRSYTCAGRALFLAQVLVRRLRSDAAAAGKGAVK